MIHPRIFRQTVLPTALLQCVPALGALLIPALSGDLLLGVRLAIALGGGYYYGTEYDGGLAPSAIGGALSGGLAVLPAVILTVSTGRDAGSMILVAAGAAMLSGAIGGALGAYMARRRRQSFK